eukprot:TRINITY_DN3061_c0_g1_i1.p1 TRINITY_DN3061_c0_g1~~TRINITY_DN3061_c0_g1_i1.p1  ORF type:complete len:302 (-),score=7.02 TRINITY_DN3061_c0_g1_i1:287-1093(-)
MTPERLHLPGPFVQVSCGSGFTMALKSDHTLYGFGTNLYGQLGAVEPKRAHLVPVRVGVGGRIVRVACGNIHTLALASDGSVYGWGYNGYGQLGVGSADTKEQGPVKVGVERICRICCGGNVSVALDVAGRVYCWGETEGGPGIWSPKLADLGDVAEISCTGSEVLAVTRAGELYSWGMKRDGPLRAARVDAFGSRRVTEIACGEFHSLALVEDGALYGWGRNTYGQVGIGCVSFQEKVPTRIEGIDGRIVEMKCGYQHSMVITEGKW